MKKLSILILTLLCSWPTGSIFGQIINDPIKEPANSQGVKIPPGEWKKSTEAGSAYFDGAHAGIGTKNPKAPLHVNGEAIIKNLQADLISGTKNKSLSVTANGKINNGSQIMLYSNNDPMGYGRMDFNIGETAHGWGWVFSQFDGANFHRRMVIRTDGKVEIGNVQNVNGNYRLYVEKGILTERLKIALNDGSSKWSDFVFDANYQLPPLSQVEAFIKENKHLPDIPSEKEVKAHGIDVAEMDALLLQKIEELTLYVIEQNKRIEALEKQNHLFKSGSEEK